MAQFVYDCPEVSVVGAGLAGTECALQLARFGFRVNLYEMRGIKSTPAHQTIDFAELVCSNSFGSQNELSAPGLLKTEAQMLGSFILKAAKMAAVPAGQALGVDRQKMSAILKTWVEEDPHITVHRALIQKISEIPKPAVIATGPLTEESLATDLRNYFGKDFLYFFDAIAPIVDADSIDTTIAWRQDRYDKGSPDYLNCPLSKEEYFKFIEEIKNARKIEPKHFETTEYFESCMPIEALVDRGPLTLRFGPMKSVGLTDPRTGKYPFAAVQLRQENQQATCFNMVGFQTRMAYPEQIRVFRTIPGLQNAEFLKLGSMHRNLYINSRAQLSQDLSDPKDPFLFFAGQITGVEGYFESACMGLLTAHFLSCKLLKKPVHLPPATTALGALLYHITDRSRAAHFQPTNINWGLFTEVPKFTSKELKRSFIVSRAREHLSEWIQKSEILSSKTENFSAGSLEQQL